MMFKMHAVLYYLLLGLQSLSLEGACMIKYTLGHYKLNTWSMDLERKHSLAEP